jgi:predicted RNase H-related nuclease YkuK (DUF458 family)
MIKYQSKIDIEEVKNLIRACGPDTKVYLGADSERIRLEDKWFADYTVVLVVHVNGKNGGKIFGEVSRERDFDQRKDRPITRLMNEVIKVCALYNSIKEHIEDYEIEMHLDINSNKIHGSSCVVDQAIGYVRGVCGVEPKIKPDAFAATFCADRLKELRLANFV